MPAALPFAFRSLPLAALLLCVAARAQDLPGQQAPTAISTPALAVKPPVKAERTFLMSAFMATSQDKLSLFTSTDGVPFTSLASEAYQPPKELLRDPSIIRAADG